MIHVVLYEPEIPQNTGNIMRTCMAANLKLHLIEPLGFYLDEKHVRRAGMDYIKDLDYRVYPNWEEFLKLHQEGEFYYMTRYGNPRSLTSPRRNVIFIWFSAKKAPGFQKKFCLSIWTAVCVCRWYRTRVP